MKALQEFLKDKGYYKGKVDGEYGKKTSTAYEKLRKDYSNNNKLQPFFKNMDTHIMKCGGKVHRKYQMGGAPDPMVPIQTEVGEQIVMPTGEISKVKAKKRHSGMKDDEVTDLAPQGTYILSRDPKMRVNKKDLDITLGYTPVNYEEGKELGPSESTEINFQDIFGKKSKMTLAELGGAIRNKFPVTDRENDAFSEFAKTENLTSRLPYLGITVALNEANRQEQNPGIMQYGGDVERWRNVKQYPGMFSDDKKTRRKTSREMKRDVKRKARHERRLKKAENIYIKEAQKEYAKRLQEVGKKYREDYKNFKANAPEGVDADVFFSPDDYVQYMEQGFNQDFPAYQTMQAGGMVDPYKNRDNAMMNASTYQVPVIQAPSMPGPITMPTVPKAQMGGNMGMADSIVGWVGSALQGVGSTTSAIGDRKLAKDIADAYNRQYHNSRGNLDILERLYESEEQRDIDDINRFRGQADAAFADQRDYLGKGTGMGMMGAMAQRAMTNTDLKERDFTDQYATVQAMDQKVPDYIRKGTEYSVTAPLRSIADATMRHAPNYAAASANIGLQQASAQDAITRANLQFAQQDIGMRDNYLRNRLSLDQARAQDAQEIRNREIGLENAANVGMAQQMTNQGTNYYNQMGALRANQFNTDMAFNNMGMAARDAAVAGKTNLYNARINLEALQPSMISQMNNWHAAGASISGWGNALSGNNVASTSPGVGAYASPGGFGAFGAGQGNIISGNNPYYNPSQTAGMNYGYTSGMMGNQGNWMGQGAPGYGSGLGNYGQTGMNLYSGTGSNYGINPNLTSGNYGMNPGNYNWNTPSFAPQGNYNIQTAGSSFGGLGSSFNSNNPLGF